MTDITYAWHFLREDGRLTHGDGRLVVPGETLSIDGSPVMCSRGMHASESVGHALRYAPGPLLCRVAVWGAVEHDDDKLVGMHRHVLWMVDASDLLWLFACDCAEWALEQELAAGRDVDVRSYAAIEARREWVSGCDVDLSAAWRAARGAAWKRSWSAAWSAAWSASRGAAWSAAWSAADSAADSAAWGAAWRASRNAAWSAFSAYLESAAVDEAKTLGAWVADHDPRTV